MTDKPSLPPDQAAADNAVWREWAVELQFLAQTGLTYSRDPFDLERFQRIRDIAAEIMSRKSGLSLQKVEGLFCNETGFQTPKLDTRAAIFDHGKILLVQENKGTWALPGGWVDVNQSIRDNAEKEAKEEAGLDVAAERLIALHDRNRHNQPPYAYGICKVFVLCRHLGGAFTANHETIAAAWFAPHELPPLALEKNTPEQIDMCFRAYRDPHWQVVFD
ncbi:MAG: NUDIX hydrolase [Victivallales bacterium]|nr:NUDIX hydrolase [Victivallales bacterium]